MNRIQEWPIEDRPQEKLLTRGAENLTDAELLAILLRTGNRATHQNALDIARTILAHFANLDELRRAGIGELTEIPGVGEVKAAMLKASLELARRASAGAFRTGNLMLSSRDVYLEYAPRLQLLQQELVIVILLDARNRRIKDVIVSQGSLTESIAHPRDIFVPALRECAAAIIVVHNHPSGDPEPGRADIEQTHRMVKASELLGIRLLDHIIIGKGTYYSFSDKSLADGGNSVVQ